MNEGRKDGIAPRSIGIYSESDYQCACSAEGNPPLPGLTWLWPLPYLP
jgi:hypothetical protein